MERAWQSAKARPRCSKQQLGELPSQYVMSSPRSTARLPQFNGKINDRLQAGIELYWHLRHGQKEQRSGFQGSSDEGGGGDSGHMCFCSSFSHNTCSCSSPT